MGVNVLPDIYNYWSLQETYHYFPVASRISRKWFLEICRYLHFVDNSTLAQCRKPKYDRLGKIQPVIDDVNDAFLLSTQLWEFNRWGNDQIQRLLLSNLKQYVPLKPVKCGIKAWVCADARNGIMCVHREGDQPETNLGAKVVKKLTRNIAGHNHIYCDNCYTSVPLFEELLQDDSTYVTVHDKTMHIAPTTDFELRPPLPTTTFELSLSRVVMKIWAKMYLDRLY